MLVDSKRGDFRLEGLTGNAQLGRCAVWTGDAPAGCGEGRLDHLPFGLGLDALLLWQRGTDRNAWVAGGVGVAREPRFVNRERVAVAQDHGPLDDILEFPNVPGPVV